MPREKTKTAIVREYVIRLIEDGTLSGGDLVPPAREIATRKGVSFAKAQQGIDSLRMDGIVHSTPRQGTYVRNDWNLRPLRRSLWVRTLDRIGADWLRKSLAFEIPELRIGRGSLRGEFEIDVTLNLLAIQHELLDLAAPMAEAFDGLGEFHAEPFKGFRKADGALFAVPLIYSPRVVYYNMDMFSKARCVAPRTDWTWDEFAETVAKLRRIFPYGKVYPVRPAGLNVVMALMLRAGGGLLDSEGNVIIDSERSRLGLKLFKQLLPDNGREGDFGSFAQGTQALSFSPRQLYPELHDASFAWGVAGLPLIEGGANLGVQTTEALCVRKSCSDPELLVRLLKFLLSEKVQDHIGRIGYGIPVRKSSAAKTLDTRNSKDKVFISEASKLTTAYGISDWQTMTLLEAGLKKALHKNSDVDDELYRLGDFFRTYFELRRSH